jgi:hypothetical protein
MQWGVMGSLFPTHHRATDRQHLCRLGGHALPRGIGTPTESDRRLGWFSLRLMTATLELGHLLEQPQYPNIVHFDMVVLYSILN